MSTSKCYICKVKVPTAKNLKNHYKARHSKSELISALLKVTFRNKFRNLLKPKRCSKSNANKNEVLLYNEPQYFDKNNQDLAWNPNENFKLGNYVQNLDKNVGVRKKITFKDSLELHVYRNNYLLHNYNDKNTINNYFQNKPATTTSKLNIPNYFNESTNVCTWCTPEQNPPLKISKIETKTPPPMTCLKTYRIQESTFNNLTPKSLNEKSGKFYICHCKEDKKDDEILNVYQKHDLKILASDTDSCSDTNTNYFLPIRDVNLYCDVCGSGYKNKRKLTEHMKVHETKCRVCNENFPSRSLYKQHLTKHLLKTYVCHLCKNEFAHKTMLLDHLDAHMEDEVYDNVFSLEEDYRIEPRFNTNFARLGSHANPYQTLNTQLCNCQNCFNTNYQNWYDSSQVYNNNYGLYSNVCPICKIGFFTYYGYIEHIQNVHYTY